MGMFVWTRFGVLEVEASFLGRYVVSTGCLSYKAALLHDVIGGIDEMDEGNAY